MTSEMNTFAHDSIEWHILVKTVIVSRFCAKEDFLDQLTFKSIWLHAPTGLKPKI
jgi:hypothetical protein